MDSAPSTVWIEIVVWVASRLRIAVSAARTKSALTPEAIERETAPFETIAEMRGTDDHDRNEHDRDPAEPMAGA